MFIDIICQGVLFFNKQNIRFNNLTIDCFSQQSFILLYYFKYLNKNSNSIYEPLLNEISRAQRLLRNYTRPEFRKAWVSYPAG